MKPTKTQWYGGQLLAFSGVDGQTDFAHGLVGRTSFKKTAIEIKLPVTGTIHFSDKSPANVILTGDYFILDLPEGIVKGAIVDAHHILISGPCKVEGDGLSVMSVDGKTQVGVKKYFAPDKVNLDIDEIIRERSRWLDGLPLPDGLDPGLEKPLLKALSTMKTQILAPEGNIRKMWTTPDRWPHRGMWLWDSVFHAIGLRHLDPGLARQAIDSVLDMQRDDGFIPHQMTPTSFSHITQPPILALGVKQVNEFVDDPDWIRWAFPKLKTYLEWNVHNRDTDGNGLLEWFIEENENCRSGESGMDNSPRFDSALQLDAVDFNAFMALEYEILAEFASEMGDKEEAGIFKAKHQTLCSLINGFLWNDEHGFYMDYDMNANCHTGILASSGFLPLICGAASRDQAERLVEHLNDANSFATEFPVASIARSCEAHYSKDMWRGPVWTNLNWLIAYGLGRYGYTAEAKKLVDRTIEEQVKMFEKYGTFFEFYDDRCQVDPPQLLRKGKCNPEQNPYNQVFHDYGWSNTLFVDMVYWIAG